MGEVIKQDPLHTLSYILFELTGEKLYEIFHFITRNPYISRVVRQRYGKKRAGRVIRARDTPSFSNGSRMLRRSQVSPVVDEEDDYELPQDAPYIPVDANTTAAAEKAKLETLEAELARLRAEMASFMHAQASSAPAPPAGSSPATTNREYETTSFAGEPYTPPRRPNFGAPPAGLSAPPPPPPPPSSSFASSLLSGAHHTQAGSAASASSSANSTSSDEPAPSTAAPVRTHHHSLSLSDMVKNTSRGSLRKVEGERSPGGTVKREQKINPNPHDMAEVIQQAMRRRFKSVSGSPDAKPTQSRVSTEPSDFDE